MSHVIVPGIWNSDDDHWQSHWERRWRAEDPTGVVRIAPSSWEAPVLADWAAAIGHAVDAVPEPVVLVAHSLGCLAVAAWLAEHSGRVSAAFLVAPPDPASASFPAAAASFPAPSVPVATPTLLVVSDDDPYCSRDVALAMARRIGAAVAEVGALGHVNVASGVGAWPEGLALLADLEASAARSRPAG